MDNELIKRALCFHGKPLQMIWADRGVGDLQLAGVPEDGNYSIYMERQKYFTFQDRAKRLQIQQFLASKAGDLYDNDISKISARPIALQESVSGLMACLPPFETFLTKNEDKVKRLVLESIKVGDIIYAQVERRKRGPFTFCVQPLCTDDSNFKMLQNYSIRSMIPATLCEPPTADKQGIQPIITTNDYVRCELFEFSIDAERMTLSLRPSARNKNIKLGKITVEELPSLYCKLMNNENIDTYEGYLLQAKEINNPNYDILYAINGLDSSENYTMMHNLKYGYPREEYATELRQQQASKWAFRSVAEGIEYFKDGQHIEAFQCLNKALNIDPQNVEGLVARGALYASKTLYIKAVKDFVNALKLNPLHANARKYTAETLVALGKNYEEGNRIQDAAKAYRDCLNIIPTHEQARLLLDTIEQRTAAPIDALPSISIDDKQCESTGHLNKLKSSPNNDSGSKDTSSSSSSESEDKNSAKEKRCYLSPLSKKMVLHAKQMRSAGDHPHVSQPFKMSSINTSETSTEIAVIPKDFKLDDDDTESRVRKLLEDALKHKKNKEKTKKYKKSEKCKKSKSSERELKNRHRQNLTVTSFRTRDKSKTPPSLSLIRFGLDPLAGQRNSSMQSTVGHSDTSEQKLSSQNKKPIKIDKFELARLKSNCDLSRKNRSRSRSRVQDCSRSRKHSCNRSNSRKRLIRIRSRSPERRRNWRSGSRSIPRERCVGRRGRRSRSSSSSRSGSVPNKKRYYKHSLSRIDVRRSPTPSYAIQRAARSPRRYNRRSRSPRDSIGRRGGRGHGGGGSFHKFGNHIARNQNNERPPDSRRMHTSSDGRWAHDRFANGVSTLEEVDAIIAKADKERKLKAYAKDKHNLNKPNYW